MFTGIVTEIGRIEAVEPRGDLRVRVAASAAMAAADLGASIACSGVCLTVVDKGAGWFALDVSAETQSRTAPIVDSIILLAGVGRHCDNQTKVTRHS